jgi:curved DNA-binding protein
VINCYKILEVDNFADETTIRKAYIRLAKLHHPDVAKHSDGETFKIVSKAYDTLSDDDTKHYHDLKLSYYLQPHKKRKTAAQHSYAPEPKRDPRDPKRPKSRKEYLERKERAKRFKLRVDMLFYQKQHHQLRYEYRILGWIVLAFWGWQQVYSHWFVNHNSPDHLFAALGILLFLIATMGMYSNLYKLQRFYTYSGKRKYRYTKSSTRTWFIFLLIGLITLPAVNAYRKSYHLSHYGEIAMVNFRWLYLGEKVEIEFTPKGSDQSIIKQLNISDKTIMDQTQNWIMIRFSKANPRIMEVVEEAKYIDYLPAPLN